LYESGVMGPTVIGGEDVVVVDGNVVEVVVVVVTTAETIVVHDVSVDAPKPVTDSARTTNEYALPVERPKIVQLKVTVVHVAPPVVDRTE
jgi:hypothetical protein